MRKALYMMGILDDSDLEWMASQGTEQQVPAGTMLIQKGSPIGSLFIILDGKLSIWPAPGRSKDTVSLFCGEILGEMSFVDSRLPLASVGAADDSHVLAIPRDKLREKLEQDSGFAARFYRAVAVFLADRFRTTVAHLGYADVQDEGLEDELDEAWMNDISMGAARFEKLLKKLNAKNAYGS